VITAQRLIREGPQRHARVPRGSGGCMRQRNSAKPCDAQPRPTRPERVGLRLRVGALKSFRSRATCSVRHRVTASCEESEHVRGSALSARKHIKFVHCGQASMRRKGRHAWSTRRRVRMEWCVRIRLADPTMPQRCAPLPGATVCTNLGPPRRAASWPARSVRHRAGVWHRVLFAATRATPTAYLL
jgi:hypothetical protein